MILIMLLEILLLFNIPENNMIYSNKLSELYC